MQGLSWLLLVGTMRAWLRLVRQGSENIPRPTGPPQAHSPGAHSDRVLILGGGPASGWGVTSHDLALPGSLARALSARTGRGSDVSLAADPFGFLEQLPNLLIGQDLGRLNAVVVFVGANDAVKLTPEKKWEQNMNRLLRALEAHTLDDTYVYVVEIQPIRTVPIFDSVLGSIANLHARRLTVRTERVCRAVPRAVYVPLTENTLLVSGRYRNSMDYRVLGEFLADEMASRLDLAHERLGANEVEPTVINVAGGQTTALDRYGIQQIRINRALALAQQSFGTESAVFVLRDHDRLLVVASAGPSYENRAWAGSLSAMVALQPGAVVVGDLHASERFSGNSPTSGPPYIRFYAGFPIESPSGERIGALCVFDPKPRNGSGFNSVLLRQLALMIQDELHANGEFRARTP